MPDEEFESVVELSAMQPMSTGNFLADVATLAAWFDVKPRAALVAIVAAMAAEANRGD
jgi:hypothetical protein